MNGAGTVRRRARTESLAWGLLAVLTLWACSGILRDDFRTRPVVGDQASFVLQALSLAADGHDLSFDEDDIRRWRDVGWNRNPNGLLYQEFFGGYAFAKPYGTSVVHAVPVALLGARWGFAAGQAALLLGSVGITIALLRLRLRGAVVPLVAAAYVFGSNLWWHGFVIMTELFLVCLVGATLYALVRGIDRDELPWILAGAAMSGAVLAEKAPMLFLLAPVGLLALHRVGSWRRRFAVLAVGGLALAVYSLPYLHYSDGESPNPYGGERYYALNRVPFDPEPGPDEVVRAGTDEVFSAGYVRDTVATDIPAKARAAVDYLVAQRTGMVPFMPVAALVLGGVTVVAVRRRGLDPLPAALFAGAVGYVGFYVWFFPENYYGGAQSMGNRYWVQASAVVIALAAVGPLRARTLRRMAVTALAVSALVVPHHHLEPEKAYVRYKHAGTIQGLFPLDASTG